MRIVPGWGLSDKDSAESAATGHMMQFATPAIILEGVFCRSELSSCRLFCPRSIYSYWREIWLERVQAPPDQVLPEVDEAR